VFVFDCYLLSSHRGEGLRCCGARCIGGSGVLVALLNQLGGSRGCNVQKREEIRMPLGHWLQAGQQTPGVHMSSSSRCWTTGGVGCSNAAKECASRTVFLNWAWNMS